MLGSLSAALQTRDLRRLQLACGASSVGSWVFFVVLAIYAYQAGGAPAVGAAAVVRMVPAALAAPAAGLLTDRRPRRDVLFSTLVLRWLVLLAIAGAVQAAAPLAAVLTLAALFTMVTAAHRPAQAALLPSLAQDPRQLTACNALWSGVDNLAFFVGSLAGGALVAGASIQAAFAVTALLFAAAALPVARLPRDLVPAYRAAGAALRPWTGVSAGFTEIAADRGLRAIVGFLAATTFVEGAVDVLVVVVALDLLELGGAGVGWLNACWGAGGLLGAAALGLSARGRPSSHLAAGGLLVGVSLMWIGALTSPPVVAALIGLLGAGYALIEVAGRSLLQRLVSDAVLGRAFAAVESTYWLMTGLGALLAPLVIALLGPRAALVAVGAGLPLIVALRLPVLRRLDVREPVPERGFAALRSVADFAPLPLATVERVARRLSALRLPAGAVVVREGEPGDCCYIVAEGELDVSRDRTPGQTLRAGDLFGELALLGDARRTATVTASDDVLLFSLDRADFLSTVGAHPPTTAAVAATATTRADAR